MPTAHGRPRHRPGGPIPCTLRSLPPPSRTSPTSPAPATGGLCDAETRHQPPPLIGEELPPHSGQMSAVCHQFLGYLRLVWERMPGRELDGVPPSRGTPLFAFDALAHQLEAIQLVEYGRTFVDGVPWPCDSAQRGASTGSCLPRRPASLEGKVEVPHWQSRKAKKRDQGTFQCCPEIVTTSDGRSLTPSP